MRKWLSIGIPIFLFFVALGFMRNGTNQKENKTRREVASSNPRPKRVSDPPTPYVPSNKSRTPTIPKSSNIKRLDAVYGKTILEEVMELDRRTQIEVGKIKSIKRQDNRRVERYLTPDGKGHVMKSYRGDHLHEELTRTGNNQFGRIFDLQTGRPKSLIYWNQGEQHQFNFDPDGRIASATHVAKKCYYIQTFQYGELVEEIQDCQE